MGDIENDISPPEAADDKAYKIIQEIVALERAYYFERKNVKSERQKKVKDIIERHSSAEEEPAQ